jgi:DNA-binding XRE family transcriptional regulator
MARSYEDVVGPRRRVTDENLTRFAAAAAADLQEAYEHAFGLGEAIAARRAELHLSQTQLAAATGVPQADISRIERGKGNPTMVTVGKILDELKLKLQVQPIH